MNLDPSMFVQHQFVQQYHQPPSPSKQILQPDMPVPPRPRGRPRSVFRSDQGDDKPIRKPAIIEQGEGTKLGEIPNVSKRLGAVPPSELFLKKLHRILFPGASAIKKVVKKNLKEFSGLVFHTDKSKEVKLIRRKFSKLEKKELKYIAELLDCESSGSKESLVDRVVLFLMKPEPSGKPYKQKKLPKKIKKKDRKKKRAPSAYNLFLVEKREEVRSQNPTAKFGEVSRILGAAWKSLSEDEKAVYKKRADELAILKKQQDALELPEEKKKESSESSEESSEDESHSDSGDEDDDDDGDEDGGDDGDE